MDRRRFVVLAGVGVGAPGLMADAVLASGCGRRARRPNPDKGTLAPDLTLRFSAPARSGSEALPLGNGLMGALVKGEIERETIHLNEGTLWTGHPRSYANDQALRVLEPMRELIYRGKESEAAALSTNAMGRPAEISAFQPFCDLHMDFYSAPRFDSYERSLDMRTAVAELSALSDAGEFSSAAEHRREAFVSYPDKVFCQRISGRSNTGQTVKLSFSTVHPDAKVSVTAESDVLLVGQLGPQTAPSGTWIGSPDGPGLRFAALMRVSAEGGTITAGDREIVVRGADEIVIRIALATSHVSYKDMSGDPIARVREAMKRASRFDYAQLKARHVQDFRAAFGDVELTLGIPPTKSKTDLDFVAEADDPNLYALMFQVGRYLLISSSRAGGQPANLQGIWNEHLWPWWGSKYTTNINLQMNYWLAGVAALEDSIEPFVRLLEEVSETGKDVAQLHYGCRGSVLHHNTDLWRATAPVDGFWGLWPVGGAWLLLQALDMAAFFPDNQAYRARLYPLLRECVLFFRDFLTTAPGGTPFAGRLVTNPSVSPENWYVKPDGSRAFLTYAPTMDIEILSELFQKFGHMVAGSDHDRELVTWSRTAKTLLPPIQINGKGEIQEWIFDFGQGEEKHRHISHLYAVYPGTGISRDNPEMFAAARRTLLSRGDDDPGGATFKAYRAALWARLRDGNSALRLLKKQMSRDTTPNMLRDKYDQFDARIAAPAAIAEMLVQSHDSEIEFLPALPTEWPDGAVQGLRARGGVTVDMTWRNGKLSGATLWSTRAQDINVRSGSLARRISLCEGSCFLNPDLRRVASSRLV